MKIITLNINGVRAGKRKGFFEWLAQIDADIICLQEIKAQNHQLTDTVFHPENYHCHYFCAERPGYSGVAIYAKQKPINVQEGLGFELADSEGRYLQFDFERFSIASLYLPSGSHNEDRQALKYDFMDRFETIMNEFKQQKREFIICGDWNIAHKKIDIKNWRGNQKNSGFLPEERAWLDKLFDEMGFVDAFRQVNQQEHQYTWWSNRGRAWDNNVGWRIDYHITTPGLHDKVNEASIYKQQRFSDHAPLIIDYDTF